MLKIHYVGTYKHHDKGFTLNRPQGTNDYLFLYFETPVEFHLEDKVAVSRENCCFIYPPNIRQFLTTPDTEMRTHWIHFSGPYADNILKTSGLPMKQIFYPRNFQIIPGLISKINEEINQCSLGCNEMMRSYLTQLLVQLSRDLETGAAIGRKTRGDLHLLETFKKIRSGMMARPQYRWKIQELARTANLSYSRFLILYRKFFGTSPMADLITCRIEQAKYLLTNQALSVLQVSEQLGYQNQFHFIRQFKAHTGVTPGKYTGSL